MGKGSRYTNTSNEYVKLYIPGVGVIEEHRFIVEKYLGRKLEYNEIVHHKNGDKHDNRLENLEVISRSERAKMHGRDKTNSALVRMSCAFCGKDIYRLQSNINECVKRGQSKFYCNKVCSGRDGKGR